MPERQEAARLGSAGVRALQQAMGSHRLTFGHLPRALLFPRYSSHPSRQCLFGVTPIVGHLQVHPEFRQRLEKRSQSDRRAPVRPLSSFRIAVIRLGGTPFAFESPFAVRPGGFKNSWLGPNGVRGRTTLSCWNFANSLPWKRVFYVESLVFDVEMAAVSFTGFSQRIASI